MKKFFTLAAIACMAMSVNAQEVWDASSVTDLTVAEQTIKATENVDLKIASFLNEKDIQDDKTPWSFSGGEGTNLALSTDKCDLKFNSYLKGAGNPYAVDNGGYWEETDNGTAWRDDPNATVWTEGCGLLPVHGTYVEFTVKADGSIKMGVFVNKGNHSTYIVDEDTKAHIAANDIKVAFYYQNNGFTFDDNGTTVDMVTGTMPEDFIIQHTNGYTQNRQALGYMTFPVKAGKKYMVFNPKSQIGLYGFKFTAGGEQTGISDITANTGVDANAPIYNLAGQRVNKDAKGILIQNGRKFIK